MEFPFEITFVNNFMGKDCLFKVKYFVDAKIAMHTNFIVSPC